MRKPECRRQNRWNAASGRVLQRAAKARPEPSSRLRRTAFLVAALLIMTGPLRADPPAWLQADARLAPPARPYVAEVLRDETVVTIDVQGGWTETLRYAVRVGGPTGLGEAKMAVGYVEKADKILSATAWLLRSGQRPKTYPFRRWTDAAAMNQTTLYTDFRALTNLDGARDAAVGDVYGAEAIVRRGNEAGQHRFSFGGRRPLRHGRIEFRLPPGWQPDLLWLKGPGPAAQISSDRTVWVWEVSQVPAVKEEPWAPALDAPYLGAVTLRAPAGAATAVPQLQTWSDFARWNATIQHPQCDTNATLKAKVAALTAGLTDPWQKMEALAKFAQKQFYIQQYQNTGLGFGYRPRLASQVLAAGYGDCKDKANLLKALLNEAGFRAHFTCVLVRPGIAVRPEWPGQQFNHAILAIELPAGVEAPAAVTHPVFGRLLFFDPTHPWVPFGQLPWQEHGTLGLLCETEETALTSLPVFPPESAWSSVSRLDLAFSQQGILHGTLTETTVGEPAAQARRRASEASPMEKRQYWTSRLSRTVNGVKVGDPVEQELPGGRHQTVLSFAAREFGQLVQDKLFVLRLDVLNRDTVPAFPDQQRVQPVVLRPVHEVQEVRFDLPAAGAEPELPANQSRRSEFGRYEGAYAVEDGWLVYRRTFTLQAGTIPPEKYAALRAFLGEVAQAEATAVTVRLKPAPLTAAAGEP